MNILQSSDTDERSPEGADATGVGPDTAGAPPEAEAALAPPRFLLPADAYTTGEWFDEERRRLFSRTWHLVGSADELAVPGAAVTVEAGNDPLVVIRDDDHVLRAFHNLCPHRCYKLVAHSGPLGQSLTCAYHFWNFKLDGSLRNVPQGTTQFPDLDKAAWGLRPAACAEWEGMVFAHPDPAADFGAWLGDYPSALGSHRPGRISERVRVSFEARCNWKLFVENHVDVLHLWYLHARTLATADHDQFEWQQLGPHWASYEPLKKEAYDARREGMPPLPLLDDRDRRGVLANLLFPNIMMAADGSGFLTYVARPVAPDRTVIDLRIRAHPDADVDALLAVTRPFLLEDIEAAERVQQNAASSRFAVGPLGKDHERPIELFHTNLLEALAGAPASR